jgi:23S rRNA (pseudouridine1915-N3)-methyltransferase
VRLRFVWIGKTKDRRLAELEDSYLRRLGHLVPTERLWAPEVKKAVASQLRPNLDREAKAVEAKLGEGTLIVLDEAGRQFTSQELARQLQQLMNQGAPAVTFVVGGFLGIPDQIKKMANVAWSLGKLTLPHELARVVVLEQVYRSMSIIRSLPYHK